MRNYGILNDTDSYKMSHYLQFPPGTTGMRAYIEARGIPFLRGTRSSRNRTVEDIKFFGLQMIVRGLSDLGYMPTKLIQEGHGLPFNVEGWNKLLSRGNFPINIKAMPEGALVPRNVPLVTIESEDPDCFWIVSWLETMLLRVWYPTTVATKSWHIKQDLIRALENTADNLDALPYMLHDFGSRAATSPQSAAIGGAAHLTNFKGTDTRVALHAILEEYGTREIPGVSIPATEHGTMTAWGPGREKEAFSHMLKTFADYPAVSVVSDSYDYEKALDIWRELKDEVENTGATLVIRPDSGDPGYTILKTLETLHKDFGSTKNTKNFRVLNKVRVIYGDGLSKRTIHNILQMLEENGWAVDNLVFGMGGGLLQDGISRSNFDFAQKTSQVKIDGEWVNVNKETVGKASKGGNLTTMMDSEGNVACVDKDAAYDDYEDLMVPIVEDGYVVKGWTWSEVLDNETYIEDKRAELEQRDLL